MKLLNNYFILRHGEARSNKERFVSSWLEKIKNPLTKKGRGDIQKIIPKLKRGKIDLIFSSDLLRCRQTAEMVAKELGLKINFDKRLREHNFGIFNGSSEKEWIEYFVGINRFKERPPKGENWTDIKKRVKEFLKYLEKKYNNKIILVIAHGDVLLSLQWIINNLSGEEAYKNRKELRLTPGRLKKL